VNRILIEDDNILVNVGINYSINIVTYDMTLQSGDINRKGARVAQ
jgi:hypothetical protein